MSADPMLDHLRVDCYNGFQLTEAVRPALHVPVVPRQGYRREVYRDDETGERLPVLAAAVSREGLFDLFLDLLEPLGEVVDVVLETSHDRSDGGHHDLPRDHIDRPVLASHCCDFEDLLLNDGCTGLAVLSPTTGAEVQFDEHKLLVVYAPDPRPFERILRRHGIERDDRLRLITEGEHLHRTDPRHADAFERLCYRLGVAEPAERVNWE